VTLISKRAKLSVLPWALTFWQMLIGSLFILLLAYSLGERWTLDTSARQWLWFAWLAVPGSTGAFGLWFIALKSGGAVRTSSFLFLAPLFATLLSLAVFGTSVTVGQIFGGVLIAVALWLVNRMPSQRTNPSQR
jgi:drug/metabolite transporter (DMT)-like permease